MGVNGKRIVAVIGFDWHSERARFARSVIFGLSIYIQNRMYVQGVTLVGGAPITIPLELDQATLRTIYDSLDGAWGRERILIPVLYEEEPHELRGAVDAERLTAPNHC